MVLPPSLQGLVEGWLRWVTRNPRKVLISALLLTFALAAGGARLVLRMDGRAMVPPEDPIVVFDREVRQVFGVRDPLIVVLESRRPEGIYHPDYLRKLAEISEAVKGIEGICDQNIVSLATERRDRVYPGTLKFRPFLDPFPDTPVLMERLREDIAAAGILLEGTLVSRDEKAAAIFLGTPDVDDVGDRGPIYRELVRRVAAFEDPNLAIKVVGAPAAEALLGHHIMDDMALLLPLSILSMAIMLFLRLKRHWGAMLGMIEVGCCLLATFGLMGWCGVPISLTSGVLPLVVVSLCLAEEIHIFSHYQALLGAGGERDQAEIVVQTFKDMAPPILLAAATTGFGFLSFLASPIAPIREFGAFAAFGTFYSLLFSLTFNVAALVLLPAAKMRRLQPEKKSEDRLLRPFLAAARRPRRTLFLISLAALVMGLGISRLEVQDSWIEGFAPESQFRRDTNRVNELLLGTHNLLIHLQVKGEGEPPAGDGRQGWLLDAQLLEEIGRFEEHLRALPGVGGVIGPYSHVSTVSYLWHARKEGTRSIPADPVKVARVYRFFDVVRGKFRRQEVVTDGMDRALVSVFLKNANYRETRSLIEDMVAWRGFTRHRVELAIAGDVAVSQAMIPAIVSSQVSSLLWALVTGFGILLVLMRSLQRAALAILPASLAVAAVFGLMGWFGITLGVATSMFCSITLAVGIDYAIHFVAARDRALAEGNADPSMGALVSAGPPILTDFAVIAFSFAWMALSQVPSNGRLGILVALALGLACLFSLLGLASIWSLEAAKTCNEAPAA